MAVDNLKSCYRTLMRFRVDPELILPVRWYFCPPGALPLGAETAFGSMVWENTDREYPQPGLGEVSLTRTWDAGKAPPNVTGLSTPTPLDWLRDGLPADAVWPPPNGESPVLIDWREEASCVAGQAALLTDQGAVAVLGAEMPDVRTWQFLLFQYPPAVSDTTEFADLWEVDFPGYSRQTPGWTDPVLSGAQQATTYASTLNWTRTSNDGPEVTVFGWAAVGAGLPARLRSVQLLPAPVTLRHTGDNLTLCPVQLLMGICQLAQQFTQVGRMAVGCGQRSPQAHGLRVVGKVGVGCSPYNPWRPSFTQVGRLGSGAGLHSAPHPGFAQVGRLGSGAGLHSAPHPGFAQVGRLGSGAGLHSAPHPGFAQVGKLGGGAGLHSAPHPGFAQVGQLGGGVNNTSPQSGSAGGAQSTYSVNNDGTGGAMSLPFPAITSVENYTLSFWMKMTNSSGGFIALMDDPSRQWSIFLTSGGAISFPGAMTPNGGSGLGGGTWHHVAIVRDSNMLYLYVDGSAVHFNSNSSSASSTTVDFGDNPSGGGSNYQGNVDDVAMFAGVALSPTDIAGIAGTPGVPGSSTVDVATLSPTQLWRIEAGSGTVIADTGGSHDDGSIDSGMTWDTDVAAPLA
jgi:hypothetical protein